MSKEFKDVVIPITGEQLAKILFRSWFCLGIVGIIYGIAVHDQSIIVVTGIFGCVLSSLLAWFIGSIEFDWDLNPFHKIGYCVRLAEDWELKKKSSITSSQGSNEK